MTLPNNSTDAVTTVQKWKMYPSDEKIATDNSLKCNIIHVKY